MRKMISRSADEIVPNSSTGERSGWPSCSPPTPQTPVADECLPTYKIFVMDSHPAQGPITVKLAEVAEIRSGSALKSDGDEAFYVQVRNVVSSGLRFEDPTPGPLPPRSSGDARLREGDVVVALRGNTNWAAVVQSETVAGRPLFGTLDVGIVRLRAGGALPAYIVAYLNLTRVQAILSGRRSGLGAPRLPLAAIGELCVPLPCLDTQHAAVRLAQEAEHEQVLHRKIMETRKRLIDSLLATSLDGAAEEPVPGDRPARVQERS